MMARMLLVLLSLVYAGLSQAQSDSENNEEIDSAIVRVDGVKLFQVRGIAAYPAKRRAGEIQKNIEKLADDTAISVDTIKLNVLSDRIQIIANNKPLMAILDVDAELEGIKKELLAEVNLTRIRESIVKYRADRSPEALLKNTLYVAIATLLYIILLMGLRKAFRALLQALLTRFESNQQIFRVKSIDLLNEKQIRASITGLVTTIKLLIYLLLFYLYLQFALGLLPWTRKFAYALIDMTLHPMLVIGQGILDYSDNVVFLVVLILVVRYILKIVHMFFGALRSGRVTMSGFEPEWAWPTYRLVRLLIIAFTVVVAFPYIPGSSSDAFKGVTLFLGVLFSLGSSTYISNIIAGYTMTYRRAFRVGDRVRIGDITGNVEEIRLLVTHLRSPKNEEIIIPNSNILNTEVVNYSSLEKEQGLILHTTVGIGYEVPWRQVEAMLLMAAQRTPGLLAEPKPFVLQTSLADFAVNYELNAYCQEANKMMALYTALHQNIQDVFNEYGVQIMTPAYESDTPQPKIVPKDGWFAAPAQPPETK